MTVDFLHQEPDRTVGNPFTAYVPREITQLSRMTDVYPKFFQKLPGYHDNRFSAPGTRLNHGGPIYSQCSWRSHPSIEDDQCTLYTRSFWKSNLESVGVDLLHQKLARTVWDPFTAYVLGKGTHVLTMTNLHPKFLEKLPGYGGSRPSAPGTC